MAEQVSHKRIAKNTIALYIRGLISVVIGLYTSRVVIDTLGVDDYGVYGVAGGFVGMLAFLNAAMSGATSRFITYEMGLGNQERTKKTFANALTVHIAIAAIVLVVCEAVGVWFLNTKLNIPPDRMTATNILFQLSILSACIQITQVPYSALIISHERMGIYAYMEIANVTLKLVIVYFLLVLPGDKLVVYGILTAIVSFVIAMSYRIYCLRKFAESRTRPQYEKSIIKPILAFSGWDMYGNLCGTATNQGITFILNIFFGVAINGAASIAAVINGTLAGFSYNIITAFRPQIIKNYAQKSLETFQRLLTMASQFAALMLAMMAIPLIVETPYVFGLWLGQVPEWVVIFSRITIITAIIAQINSTLNIGIHATGRIKRLSFISGSIFLLQLPLSWIAFKLGAPPPAAFIIGISIIIAVLTNGIFIIKHNVPEFKTWRYIGKIIVLPLLTLPAIAGCYLVHLSMGENFVRFATVCATSIILIGATTYAFALNSSERLQVRAKLRTFLPVRLFHH